MKENFNKRPKKAYTSFNSIYYSVSYRVQYLKHVVGLFVLVADPGHCVILHADEGYPQWL